jgi:hypothetical protein
MVGAMDQDAAQARVAHVAEGDLVGLSMPMIALITADVKPLGIGPTRFRSPEPCPSCDDNMSLDSGRTIDAFVVVLWHFIAVIQPVLNHHLGRGPGEKDWAAHLTTEANYEQEKARRLRRVF